MKTKNILNLSGFSIVIISMFCFQNNFEKNTTNAKDTANHSVLSNGEHFAGVNGISLHYYVAGKGPVCLVPSPGWGYSVGYLYESLKPFEKYFTMVYYDTRLSGKSTGPDDPSKYTSNDFMNDMDSLRVYLGQSKIWILGHSDGGFQVLYFGIHHNNELNGIIVLDGVAGFDSLYHAEFVKNLNVREPVAPKIVSHILGKDTINYSLAEFLKLAIPLYFHDTSKVHLMPHTVDARLSQKVFDYTNTSKFGTEYLFPDLHKITVPTLVVVGDDDFICPKTSQADRIEKYISNCTEIVIKNAGHFPWIEQSNQFFQECGKWLKDEKI